MTTNASELRTGARREASSAPPILTVRDLEKTYASAGKPRAGAAAPFAVRDVSFEVRPGELVTLLGPSGCGKTTTLRSVAGLEIPDRGRIELAGRALFDHEAGVNVRANDRGVAMVFQSYAIWPHMTVAGNVAFPLEVRERKERASRGDIASNVSRMLEVVGLGGMDQRSATSLSGGQQQRLALARALVMEPSLMLLDEPLSNLDAKLRESMRIELKRLQNEAEVAAVYVTHDQEEALALSNRIAVMNEGRIVQLGTPREIYDRPANTFVADFVGASTMIVGTVTEIVGDAARVATDQVDLWAASRSEISVGDRVTAVIRPEDVQVSVEGVGSTGRETVPGEPVNDWSAEVRATAFLGGSVDRLLRLGSWEIRARTEPLTLLSVGSLVDLRIPASRVYLVTE